MMVNRHVAVVIESQITSQKSVGKKVIGAYVPNLKTVTAEEWAKVAS
jgi:hypothetical protein